MMFSYYSEAPERVKKILACMHAQSCSTLCDSMTVAHQDPLSMGFFSGKNTGVGCHFFLQGIFPTQGSNSGLLHCRWILYLLSQQRSPARTLTRNKRSRVFCTANPVDRSPSIRCPQEKAQCPSLSRPIWLVHLGREELTLKPSSQKTGTREKI